MPPRARPAGDVGPSQAREPPPGRRCAASLPLDDCRPPAGCRWPRGRSLAGGPQLLLEPLRRPLCSPALPRAPAAPWGPPPGGARACAQRPHRTTTLRLLADFTESAWDAIAHA
eukprot:4250707-Pyramimonas_sp.AAC.1